MSWLSELTKQKRKYHAKVLSDSAIAVNWQRALDTEDYFTEEAWEHTLFFNYLNYSFSVIFGFDVKDLEPFKVEFEANLPDIEEFLRGVLVKFESVDITKIFPESEKLEKFIEVTFEEEYQPEIKEAKARKGKYGISKFNECYYDPELTREFLKSTVGEIWRKSRDLESFRKNLKQLAEQLNISEGVVEAVFNRYVLMKSTQLNTFILGYGLLGVTPLAPESGHSTTVPIETYRGETMEVTIDNLEQAKYGFILGVTPLGYGYLLPKKSIIKMEKPQIDPKFMQAVNKKVRRLMNTYRYLSLGFANWQTPREQTYVHASQRAHQYLLFRTLYRFIRELIYNICDKYGLTATQKDQYAKATWHLISFKAKRHRWGMRVYKAMTEEEFYQYWLNYWKAKSLNETILKEIYERLKPWLPHLRKYKYQLGVRLKKARLRQLL